ncbi:MAG: hypothetical protein F4X44_10345 [Gammaproteobacteria bacterium]|nr:hypothetical protein [Gammaproteobacteria bacterium]
MSSPTTVPIPPPNGKSYSSNSEKPFPFPFPGRKPKILIKEYRLNKEYGIIREYGHIREYRFFVYVFGTAQSEYKERIDELRIIGDEEGILIRPESVKDFWSFMDSSRNLKKCGLFLLDGGSLSALWTSKSEYRATIRFFGQGMVQFTFIKYKGSVKVSLDSIESGKCSIGELRKEIEKFGLLFE